MSTGRLVLRYLGHRPNLEPAAPVLQPTEDMTNLPPGREFEIPPTGITIGRGAHADVPVFDCTVKREHARLSKVDGGVLVEDLASTNGTAVNGVLFSNTVTSTRALLQAGDRLTLSGTREFEIVALTGPTHGGAESSRPVR